MLFNNAIPWPIITQCIRVYPKGYPISVVPSYTILVYNLGYNILNEGH